MGRINSRTSGQKRIRKAKKSFTLSLESVDFLEAMRKRRKASSVSAILDEILRAARYEQGRAALDRDVTAYYSSLTDDEAKELSSWGEFAMHQFPDDKGG